MENVKKITPIEIKCNKAVFCYPLEDFNMAPILSQQQPEELDSDTEEYWVDLDIVLKYKREWFVGSMLDKKLFLKDPEILKLLETELKKTRDESLRIDMGGLLLCDYKIIYVVPKEDIVKKMEDARLQQNYKYLEIRIVSAFSKEVQIEKETHSQWKKRNREEWKNFKEWKKTKK